MTVNDALIIALIVTTVIIAINVPKMGSTIKMMFQNQQIDHQNLLEIRERINQIEQQLKESAEETISKDEKYNT